MTAGPPSAVTTGRRRWALAAVVLASSLLAGCGAGGSGYSGPPPAKSGPAVTYVAVSESQPTDTEDMRTDWSQLFYRTALPAWATAYQLALPAGWASDEASLVHQLASLHPTVVTVSVGLQEALSSVNVRQFSSSLDALLGAIEHAGVATVLVSNLLPVPGPQAASAALAQLIADYNRSIRVDCAAHGAVLVDAHAAFVRALRARAPVMAFGNALTPLGEELLARTFDAGARDRPLSGGAAG